MLTCPSLNSQCQIHQWTLRLLNGGWLARFEEMGRDTDPVAKCLGGKVRYPMLGSMLLVPEAAWRVCFLWSDLLSACRSFSLPWDGASRLFVREIYSFQSAIYMLFQGLPGFLKKPQTPVFASKGWRNEGLEGHCSSSAAVSCHSGVWGRKQAIQSALSSLCVMIATVWDQRFLFVGLLFLRSAVIYFLTHYFSISWLF